MDIFSILILHLLWKLEYCWVDEKLCLSWNISLDRKETQKQVKVLFNSSKVRNPFFVSKHLWKNVQFFASLFQTTENGKSLLISWFSFCFIVKLENRLVLKILKITVSFYSSEIFPWLERNSKTGHSRLFKLVKRM